MGQAPPQGKSWRGRAVAPLPLSHSSHGDTKDQVCLGRSAPTQLIHPQVTSDSPDHLLLISPAALKLYPLLPLYTWGGAWHRANSCRWSSSTAGTTATAARPTPTVLVLQGLHNRSCPNPTMVGPPGPVLDTIPFTEYPSDALGSDKCCGTL